MFLPSVTHDNHLPVSLIGIHLLKLPSHPTHILQPLDLAVFKPMKSAWEVATRDLIHNKGKQSEAETSLVFLKLSGRQGTNLSMPLEDSNMLAFHHTTTQLFQIQHNGPPSAQDMSIQPVNERLTYSPSTDELHSQQQNDCEQGKTVVSQLQLSSVSNTPPSHQRG